MVSGPLTDGCYGRGQSRTAANRPIPISRDRQNRCRLSVRTARRPTRSPTPRSARAGVRCVACAARPSGTQRRRPSRPASRPREHGAADEPVAAFRAELGGRPPAAEPRRTRAAATDRPPAEPSLDDLAGPSAAGAATATPAAEPNGRASRARRHSHSGRATRRRLCRAAARGRDARSHRWTTTAPRTSKASPPAARTRGTARAAQPAAGCRCRLAIVALVARLRGAARLAQGRRAACAAARIVLYVPSGCR